MPEYREMAVGLTYPDSFIDSTYFCFAKVLSGTKCNQVLLQSISGCVPVGKETGKAEAALLRTIPADLCESENSGATEFFLHLFATGAQVWCYKGMMKIKCET